MKKNNKISDLFGVICVAAIFAGCVEKLNGAVSWWTVGCLAVATVFGLLSYATGERMIPTTNNEHHEQQDQH